MRLRGIAGATVATLTLTLTGCSSLGASNTSDEKPAAATSAPATKAGGDPGCSAALQALGKYGPSTVKLLADGREAVTKAAVQLLVDGLDGAADAADSPQTKHAIKTLADAYDDYFDLTTDAVAIPLSTLLKDTTELEFVCK